MPPYGNNIASILQGARGLRGPAQRGQPPDIQATLASLRQQLYGMPQQGMTGGPAGGGVMQPNLGGDMLQQPQARPLPAWQQLAAMGIQGQGSPAANRAALLAAQAGAAQQGDGTVITDGGPAGAGGAAANVGAELQAVNGGGLQGGGGSGGMGQLSPQQQGAVSDLMARYAPGEMPGGQPAGPPAVGMVAGGAPATASVLPTTMTVPPPNLKPTFQGAMTPGLMQPQMPAQQRIQQARQGIRQGVQRALRKPATATGTAAPASGRK